MTIGYRKSKRTDSDQKELQKIIKMSAPEYEDFSLDDESFEIMKSYMQYYSKNSQILHIHYDVKLILIEDQYRKKSSILNQEIIQRWQKCASNISIKFGYGPHEFMLTDAYVNQNAKIINAIMNE